MEKKNLIIIIALAIIILILCGALFGVLSQTEYEKIEVVANGTTMEVPTNNLTDLGDALGDGCKIWTFEQGGIVSFNTIEAENTKDASSYQDGIDEFKEVVDPIINNYEEKENIDGYTVYTMKGETLGHPDEGTLYVIMCENQGTGDNVVIMTDNKDITLHIAKSVEFKKGDIPIKTTTTSNSNDNNDDEWVEVDLNDIPKHSESITEDIEEYQSKNR